MASTPPHQPLPHPGPPPMPPELPEQLRPQDRRPPWAPWTAPVALVAAFAAALIGGVIIGGVAGATGADLDDPPPGVLIASTYLQDIILVISALAFARLATRPAPWQFGLRRSPLWSSAGWLVLAWLAFIVFTAAWAAATGADDADDLPQELGAEESAAALVAVAVLVTVVAPVSEEIFFRGYFFTALRNWKGLWPAAIITGIVFGAIHAGSADVVFLVPLAAFGFVLCLLYAKTRSLLPAISLHALNNSLALGVSIGWSWQIPLLMLGSNAVLALGFLPFVAGRRARWA